MRFSPADCSVFEKAFWPSFCQLKQAIRWKIDQFFALNVSSLQNSFQGTVKNWAIWVGCSAFSLKGTEEQAVPLCGTKEPGQFNEIYATFCQSINQQVTNVVMLKHYALVGTPEAVCLLISTVNQFDDVYRSLFCFQPGWTKVQGCSAQRNQRALVVKNQPMFRTKVQVRNKKEEQVCPGHGLKPSPANQRFCEWFGGFVDGDGSLQLSKAGYGSLEITVATKDMHLLIPIKQKYGGAIKPRSGVNQVRYRLHNRKGMVKVLNDLNGHIRHPARLAELTKLCNRYNVCLKAAPALTTENGWFRGFFDQDGTVTLTLHRKFPLVTIRVSQKHQRLTELFQSTFGYGGIYFDKSQNGYWQWSIQSQRDVLKFKTYLKNFPRRSTKRIKVSLLPKVYNLLGLRAHLNQESSFHNPVLHQQWLSLVEKWKNLSKNLPTNYF